jgi:hypothetical protein
MTTYARRVLISAAVLSLASAAPAMSMEKESYNFWEVAECPDEMVEMEGTVRFQYHETSKGWVYQAFWEGEGWGASGAEYVIHGKWMEVVTEDRPFVFYWNDHFQLVGKGTAPTYRLYSKIRFDEFDPDSGGPVIDSIQFENGDWPCPTVDFDIWPDG